MGKTKQVPEMKRIVESLSDPNIKKKDYETALEKISTKCNEIWRNICSASGRKMDWWAFRNDMSYGHGDGSTGGEFDPAHDSEFIEIIGEVSSYNCDIYEYNDGFPTRFLWEDYAEEVVEHIKDCRAWQEEKKQKKKADKVIKQESVKALKAKLSNILSPAEMKLISFKKVR